MTGRILAAIAFVGGGIITWIILSGLQGFGAAQAGMGDGAGSHSTSDGSSLPYLTSLYFIVSAGGVLLCRKREPLIVVAGIAHTFLLMAPLVLASGSGGGKDPFMGLLLVTVITGVFFSPWIALWVIILFRSKDKGVSGKKD